MAKQNTKASAQQVSQDQAAAAAAEAARLAAEQEAADKAAQEGSSAPGQENTGVQDQSAKEGSSEGSESDSGEGAPSEEGDGSSEDTGDSKDAGEQPLTVTPVAVVPAAPAPAPAIVVVEASQPVAADAALQDGLANILKDVPAAHQIDINRILMYIERMAPKRPIDTKSGVTEQVALYRSLQNIINRQETYFTQLFSAVLYLFKTEAKGALGDKYRMRFMDNITLHAGDRKAFQHLTQVLAILADPKSRDLGLRQVDMSKALENGLTAQGQQRVLHYFGV